MIIKKIEIEFTGDPNQIRSKGVGDYQSLPDGTDKFTIYCKDDSKKAVNYAYACLFHEIYEYRKIVLDGITEKQVTDFDNWYNEVGFEEEPGDHPKSPYYSQHREAEFIERYIIDKFGERWHEYFKKYVIPEDFKYNDDYGKENNQ
jgi:hypothetical protein